MLYLVTVCVFVTFEQSKQSIGKSGMLAVVSVQEE